jgi:hypothetical protein
VTRKETLRPEFVRSIPEKLEEGVIYVSIPYTTAIHLCACGCGREVITPISPTDWKLTFDAETVSLDPSIGNWSFPCQSHYWLRRNQIRWERQMTREQIDAGRAANRRRKARHAAGLPLADEQQPYVAWTSADEHDPKPQEGLEGAEPRLIRRLLRKMSRRCCAR